MTFLAKPRIVITCLANSPMFRLLPSNRHFLGVQNESYRTFTGGGATNDPITIVRFWATILIYLPAEGWSAIWCWTFCRTRRVWTCSPFWATRVWTRTGARSPWRCPEPWPAKEDRNGWALLRLDQDYGCRH